MKWMPAVQEQLDEMDVSERVREKVEESREKVESALESDDVKREQGKLRKWFSRDR
jgi:hypothetical protein